MGISFSSPPPIPLLFFLHSKTQSLSVSPNCNFWGCRRSQEVPHRIAIVSGNRLGCLTVAVPHRFPFHLLPQSFTLFGCSHIIGQLLSFCGDVSIDRNLHVFLVAWGHEGQRIGVDLMTLCSV